MGNGGVGWWLDQIGRYDLLTPAEEIELGTAIQRWRQHPEPCPPGIRRQGERARDRFVRANLRLVMLVLRKHGRQGDQEDLIQAANLGLITAVERFDPTRGYRFSTYAYLWIRQAITRWANRHSRAIAIPNAHAGILAKIGSITRSLEFELGRSPTRSELAAALNITAATLEQVITNGRAIASLDEAFLDDGHDLNNSLASWDASPEEEEERQQRWKQAEQLRGVITRLPRADQRLICLAWGLDGEEVPRGELAKQEGISTRALESRLQRLMAHIRGQSVQLVCCAVARITPLPRPRLSRRSRCKDTEQLSFPF